MSNSIGHNLPQQRNLLGPTTGLLDQTSKRSFKSPTTKTTSHLRNSSSSFLSSKFYGKRMNLNKACRSHIALRRQSSGRASADRASQKAGIFNLHGDVELQVEVSSTEHGCSTKIDVSVTNCNDGNFVLHWGAVRNKNGNWVLPSARPEGTTVYKDKALRSPFKRSGNSTSLRIEIDDPALQGIEFLVLDESENKWFKCNGQNFHVPTKPVAVPEDLVQTQAYLRWERMGKQMYTPEREKACSRSSISRGVC